jgi:hypothetical protein
MTIDLKDYAIVCDMWEGDGDYDETTIRAGGAEGIMIRLNNSAGGLTLDKGFTRNWSQWEGKTKGAYVVINPYISRESYVTWIRQQLPADCKVVSTDVEIKGTTPGAYSKLVTDTLGDLKNTGLNVMNYSGAWFYTMLSPWPRDFDQWWARYPYQLQPTPPQAISWDQLKVNLAALPAWNPLGSYVMDPGKIVLWQCSSTYILPGGPKGWPIDINLMPRAEFERIFGLPVTPPVVPPLTDKEKLNRLWQAHPELW